MQGVLMATWGGSKHTWVNVFEWYWAIADGGSPRDLSTTQLAVWLGCSLGEAAVAIDKAEKAYRANVRLNERTGAYQRYLAHRKTELLATAKRMGLRVDGFWTKRELVDAIVNRELPVIHEPDARAA
jgi:hypothetical protein